MSSEDERRDTLTIFTPSETFPEDVYSISEADVVV